MIRKLLATTAIATLVATGAAMAQTATPPATTAPAATEAPASSEAPVARADGELASNVIGQSVYNGAAADAENIGNVNDLVLSNEGQIQSVVVGVGGFLGIGEKNVAIDYGELDMVEVDGNRRITVATTADALKELPEFDRRAYDPTPGSGTAATTTAPATTDTATNTMAPATTTAPAGDTAAGDAPAATDTTTTAAVDRSTLTEVAPAEATAEALKGTTVYGADDANVGEIGEVLMTADNKIDAVIVDVGGFLGIGEKPVAVGLDNLAVMKDADNNHYLYTSFTKEQLESQPQYEEGNWTAQRDQMRLTAPN